MQRLLILLFLFALAPLSATAVTIHDESSDGDLSGALGSPTALSFSTGANTIIGSVGANGGTGATNGSDADYFSIVIPTGATLDSITIDGYSLTSPTNGSFFGTVAAAAFTGQGFGDIDAFTIFNAGSGDVIGALGGPFGAGNQSFWLQETAPTIASYTITFNLVPEPAFAGLLLVALVAGSRRRQQA